VALCADSTVRAMDRLRALGQRSTAARRAVVEVLASTSEHIDAEQIGERVAATHPGVHRATVYRTLDTLTALDVVTHVHTGRGATAYHLAASVTGRHHLHAQCRVCERLFDLPDDLLDSVSERLAQAGFALEPHHVALSGICAPCAVHAGDVPGLQSGVHQPLPEELPGPATGQDGENG
jgi:Fur family ferric uptake transcriptional regulator